MHAGGLGDPSSMLAMRASAAEISSWHCSVGGGGVITWAERVPSPAVSSSLAAYQKRVEITITSCWRNVQRATYPKVLYTQPRTRLSTYYVVYTARHTIESSVK